MDWAAASWGAAVAAADSGPTMLSFAVPSSSSSSAAAATAVELQDFSVGLAQRARPAPPTARRARAPGGGGGGGGDACSVDGCRSDLSRCREYYRRHKVCEAHSKTRVVVVGGQEQRFCQQCSRFHMPSEFDEGKRSCRKRLDGHNRRRRKPQHDAMNPGSFFPYHQANQFLVHGQTIPVSDQNVDSFLHRLDRQPPFSISFLGTFKAPKQFPISQDGSSILGTTRPALMEQFPSAEDITTTSSTCNGLSRALDPECALSLLSSSLHPSISGIHRATAPAQFSSSFARIATSSQAATTAFAQDGAGGDSHVVVPGATFEDPSQALPFSWHV